LVIGKFSPITHYPLPVTHKPLANYALTIFYSFDMIIGLLFCLFSLDETFHRTSLHFFFKFWVSTNPSQLRSPVRLDLQPFPLLWVTKLNHQTLVVRASCPLNMYLITPGIAVGGCSLNSCGAGILPAKYVPHNIRLGSDSTHESG